MSHNTISLDLNDFNKEQLIHLIVLSDQWNKTFSDTIVQLLTNFVEQSQPLSQESNHSA